MTSVFPLGLGPTVWEAALLAQPADPGGQGTDFGKSSPIGLLLIVVLGIVTVLLIRSMNKRVRRLPASFDKQSDDDQDQQS